MKSSLTRRLMTLYVATILVVVGVAAGLVWFLMRGALYAGLDDALRSEAQALAGRLELDRGNVEFELGTNPTHSPEQSGGLVQILDPVGEVVFTSSALSATRMSVERSSIHDAYVDQPIWFTKPLSGDPSPFRVVALPTVVRDDEDSAGAAGGGVTVWVFVARSLAPVDRTLVQLAGVLGSAVGVSLLVALLGGIVVARRGTQPVRALAARVGQVDPADPRLTLDPGQVPVELQPIVDTTQRLLERVRGELSRQRQLTTDVAHDLRTPVAGVRTLLDVCRQRERSAGDYTATIDSARAALRQLSQLLDDVLTLSRLDAGVDSPHLQDALLSDVLAAAVATVQPLATTRGVRIATGPHPTNGVRTDRAKLVKVLSNLLCNAVEHSPEGGTVQLAARVDSRALELAVQDDGPGVPPAFRTRIFDRFVRGDAARAGGDGHHGLGLPIAAGLARLLGGDVSLDETGASRGARFVVRLPLH